jgi:hypothetical protein
MRRSCHFFIGRVNKKVKTLSEHVSEMNMHTAEPFLLAAAKFPRYSKKPEKNRKMQDARWAFMQIARIRKNKLSSTNCF